MEKEEKGLKINANVVTGLLRRERNMYISVERQAFGAKLRKEQDVRLREKMLEYSRDVVEGLEDDQIVALAEGRAVLEGMTPGSIIYKELE